MSRVFLKIMGRIRFGRRLSNIAGNRDGSRRDTTCRVRRVTVIASARRARGNPLTATEYPAGRMYAAPTGAKGDHRIFLSRLLPRDGWHRLSEACRCEGRTDTTSRVPTEKRPLRFKTRRDGIHAARRKTPSGGTHCFRLRICDMPRSMLFSFLRGLFLSLILQLRQNTYPPIPFVIFSQRYIS
jgi:hypothetical protein